MDSEAFLREHFKDARLWAWVVFLPIGIVTGAFFLKTLLDETLAGSVIEGGCVIIAAVIAVITGKHIFEAAYVPIKEQNDQSRKIVIAGLKYIKEHLDLSLPAFLLALKSNDDKKFSEIAVSARIAVDGLDLDTFGEHNLKALPSEMLEGVISISRSLKTTKEIVNSSYESLLKVSTRDVAFSTFDHCYNILSGRLMHIDYIITEWDEPRS